MPQSPMEALLVGEFALQEGALEDAAKHYVDASQRSRDPKLAARAAQIAMLAKHAETTERALRRWRELSPDNLEVQQAELAEALHRGDQFGARRAINALLPRRGGWRSVLRAIATDSRSLIAKALVAEVAVDPDFPERIEPLLALSGLAQRIELPRIANAVAQRAVQAFPDEPQVAIWRADLARLQGDDKLARSAIEGVLLNPELDTAQRLHIAALLDAMGDPLAAAAVLTPGPQDDRTLANRAAYLARAKDDAGLGALYAQIAADVGAASPERLYLLGQVAELRQLDDDALSWYRQTKAGLPHDQAQLRIAVLLEKRGDVDAAAEQLQQFQSSDSENGEVLVEAYRLEAALRQNREQWDAALEALDRGLSVFEAESSLLYARALLYERLDRIDAAEADLRTVLAQDPEAPEALNALGYTLADRTDRLDEARGLIELALRRDPDNPAIVDSMGWVLFRMGKLDDALPLLRRAFELQRDAEVAAHLGEALWASGEHDEARSVWRLGQELDADNRVLLKTVERFDP